MNSMTPSSKKHDLKRLQTQPQAADAGSSSRQHQHQLQQRRGCFGFHAARGLGSRRPIGTNSSGSIPSGCGLRFSRPFSTSTAAYCTLSPPPVDHPVLQRQNATCVVSPPPMTWSPTPSSRWACPFTQFGHVNSVNPFED